MKKLLPTTASLAAMLTLVGLVPLAPIRVTCETQYHRESSPAAGRQLPDSTDWSASMDSLSTRLFYAHTVEYGERIDVILEVRLRSARSHTDAASLHRDMDGRELTLRLRNLETAIDYLFTQPCTSGELANAGTSGQIWRCPLSFGVDCDRGQIDSPRYSRDSAYVWQRRRSIAVHESLPIGAYHMQVEIFIPDRESSSVSGLLISPGFTVEIVPQENGIREQVFLFPHRLGLSEGPVVRWDDRDLDTVRVSTRADHYLGFQINSECGSLRAPGLPACPVICLNPDMPELFSRSELLLKPAKRLIFVDDTATMTFVFQLAESAIASNRSRDCRIRDVSRVLWERELSARIPRNEHDALMASESELYEYHTIIVPKYLRLGAGDSLHFDGSDAAAREIRCPVGYYIRTLISTPTDSAVWINTPPPSPLPPMGRVGPSIIVPTSVRVFAIAPGQSTADSPEEWSRVLLWSGNTELTNVGLKFRVTEDFVQSVPESWPMCSYRIPSRLRLTDDLSLIADTSDNYELALRRPPGTVLIAALSTGEQTTTPLPPDMIDAAIPLTSALVHCDTLFCSLDIYERPEGSRISGQYHETIWSCEYRIPVTHKQAQKLRRLKKKPKPSFLRRP